MLPEIDVEAVGEVIFNNLDMIFTEFARDDSVSVDELKRRVVWQHTARNPDQRARHSILVGQVLTQSPRKSAISWSW